MSQLKIREMPQDERPREKLAAHGAAALTDAELIAILLRTGIPGANAIELARKLLQGRAAAGKTARAWAGCPEQCGIDRDFAENGSSWDECSGGRSRIAGQIQIVRGVEPLLSAGT